MGRRWGEPENFQFLPMFFAGTFPSLPPSLPCLPLVWFISYKVSVVPADLGLTFLVPNTGTVACPMMPGPELLFLFPARHDSRNLLICFDLLSLGVIVTRLACLHHCMGTRNEAGLSWQQEKTSLGLFFVSALSEQQVGCRLCPTIRSCRKESMQGCALTPH